MCLQRMLRSVIDIERNGDKESIITVKGKDRTDKIHGHEKENEHQYVCFYLALRLMNYARMLDLVS